MHSMHVEHLAIDASSHPYLHHVCFMPILVHMLTHAYPSPLSNGLRKGAHVHIIRPAHNSRRMGIEENDYSKSGIVTREGSSANGGWFEILLDGGQGKYVYYRRGSLEVIHHDADGNLLQPVSVEDLANPRPPSPRRRPAQQGITPTNAMKRKQR